VENCGYNFSVKIKVLNFETKFSGHFFLNSVKFMNFKIFLKITKKSGFTIRAPRRSAYRNVDRDTE